MIQRVSVIDSHTGGEPTRLVIAGGPDLGRGPLPERVKLFRAEFDAFRSAVVNEPRGSDVIVGALLCEPTDPTCAAGVIYFNNVGYIGMCGHGTIGVAVSLAHLGRLAPGTHRLETVVGVVTVTLEGPNRVSIENVPSYRLHQDRAVEVPGLGTVRGDVAWGGNWFFLVSDHREELKLDNIARLTDVTWRIRRALTAQGITGTNGQEIDHIELFGPPSSSAADSRNFVLCPGGAYDRSPCGTGTSAKLACLIADGKLHPGEVWRQESIVGSIFEGTAQRDGDRIIPRIRGNAYVNAEATLLLDSADPFCMGIRS
ncbi:MAG: proline racemase family protein [Planctomycetia bacterium]|nr:proline racemase family protein [Planctomycetia bacterium]